MILLTAQNISKTYMERKVLDDVSFFLNEGDKVGIIGINGTGKSTLLKILAGAEEADGGDIIRTNGIRISYLPQIPEFGDSGSVLEQVLLHLPKDLRQAKEYEAKSILEKLGISDQQRDISTLSGGEKRRAGIAAALIQPSDVLLLDEPTNHIDNETAQLLEDLLMKYRGAIVMVTHDRYFLNKICSKIVEIDRGKLYVCEGSYSDYLMQKAQREADAEAAERKNRSLYRRELEWISRGARARGTKSKDRIERFEALKNREMPVAAEKVQLQSVSSRLGRKTIEIENISKKIDGKPLITDFSYIVSRDARIGIVGRNGEGKSTFLKMLHGDISPDSGRIILGDTVNIGYFSQECESMDPSMRVIEYIRETADIVRTPDGTVTASQMLERFLFNSELQWNRIEKLSGGERKRLYLLKILMTAPNILLLDEPTNDLDITTLTILEDYLESFSGAVIAVSHDRYFLDKTANEIFEFRNGICTRFNGNYSDYAEKAKEMYADEAPKSKKENTKKERVFVGKKKLRFSFKEQREFETIDDDIASLEEQIAAAEKDIAANSSDYVKLQELSDKKEALETELAEKMERWVYLNDLAERIERGETE
ncbi:ABC-F family ATP-binding cassette domain-containing protein [uncultured Ruminococcus sp.]|uniref:ABC-F family ATP-binding cassette domain-containing protein n=1 Tax=uncultured Ruminococcus sp. TaxID=165186 RepID=UPI0025E4CC34|nr:ABC-F family ATP-binding cassette domain-containing protein [uncultured Ruminococcus sp.]